MNTAYRLESLLALKYDTDFYMTNKSWHEHLDSIGCSKSPMVVQCYEVEDPDSFHSSHTIESVFVPVEIGLKVLTLGGFP
jgi:hypothetical protein